MITLIKIWAEKLLSSPRLSLTFLFIALAITFIGIVRINYIGDIDTSLPNTSRAAKDFREIRSLFGSNDTIAFSISGGTAAKRLAASCALTSELGRDTNVVNNSVLGLGSSSTELLRSVDGTLTVESSDTICAQPSIEEENLASLLGPQADLILGDHESLHVFADVRIQNGAYLPFNSEIQAKIDAITSGIGDVLITKTGPPTFWAAMQKYSERMGIYFPIIMLMIGLLHFEALRSVQAAVLPLISGLLATLLTLSCMGWLGIPIDEYSSTAPVLIMAVAAGHSVQLLKRYMEELRTRAPDGNISRSINNQALVATIVAMAPVLATAVIAAASCLFALALMDIPAFTRFGLVAGGGLLFALLVELTVIPALRAAFPPKRIPANFGKLSGHWARALGTLSKCVQRAKPHHLAISFALLASLFIGGLLSIHITASVVEPFAASTPERVALDALTAEGVGSFPLDIVIDAGDADAAFGEGILKQAQSIEDMLKRDPNVSAVISPVSVLRHLKCRYAGATDCQNFTISGTTEATQLWTIFSGAGDAYPLVDDDRRYMRVRALLYDGGSAAVDPIVSNLRALPGGEHWQLGGPAMVGKTVGDGIFAATKHKVLAILMISALVGLVVFRSWLAALFFVIPSLVSAGASYAFIGWTNTSLNIATASIAALAVGIGVDYLVYFTFRLKEQLATGQPWSVALDNTYQSAGGASLCVATAVAGGYLVLSFSQDFLVHRWLGQLIPLSVLAGLLATLIIYPALLNLTRPAFLFRGAHAQKN